MKKDKSKYYILILLGENIREFESVYGYKIENKYDLDLFYHIINNRFYHNHYVISEGISGAKICQSDTLEKAIYQFENLIKEHSIEKIKETIEQCIKINGYSPRHIK